MGLIGFPSVFQVLPICYGVTHCIFLDSIIINTNYYLGLLFSNLNGETVLM